MRRRKKVSNWGFEMGPPHMLQKAGWKRNSLKIGEEVDVDGWLARDGSNTANARRVTRKSTGEVMGAAIVQQPDAGWQRRNAGAVSAKDRRHAMRKLVIGTLALGLASSAVVQCAGRQRPRPRRAAHRRPPRRRRAGRMAASASPARPRMWATGMVRPMPRSSSTSSMARW